MTADKLTSHSDSQHSEDLTVYDENTRNNVKKENPNKYTDGSQEGNEEGEVIQEFIIEEYSNENDEQVIEEATQYVKEENEHISGNEVAVKANSLIRTRLKRKPVQSRESTVNTKKRIVKEVEKSYYTDEDSADMEIETLEKDDDVDYEVEFEEDEDDDEPATKTIKVSIRGKVVTNVEKDIVKQKKLATKQQILPFKKEEKPIVSPSGKLRQTTLTSVLQQLPKGVTIIKKEKTPGIADKTSPESKEIRVLNQRIIKKTSVTSPEQVSVPAKSSKEISKPVEIKQRKSSPPIENKLASDQNNAKTKSSPKQGNSSISNQKNKPQAQQTSTAHSGVAQNQKLVEMMIGDRKVKVQKIMMTKAEVAAMAKEGKIEMKGGTMILKQDKTTSAKGMPKKSDK